MAYAFINSLTCVIMTFVSCKTSSQENFCANDVELTEQVVDCESYERRCRARYTICRSCNNQRVNKWYPASFRWHKHLKEFAFRSVNMQQQARLGTFMPSYHYSALSFAHYACTHNTTEHGYEVCVCLTYRLNRRNAFLRQ